MDEYKIINSLVQESKAFDPGILQPFKFKRIHQWAEIICFNNGFIIQSMRKKGYLSTHQYGNHSRERYNKRLSILAIIYLLFEI